MRVMKWLFPTDKDRLLKARRCIGLRDYEAAMKIVGEMEGGEAKRLYRKAEGLRGHSMRNRQPEPVPRAPTPVIPRGSDPS